MRTFDVVVVGGGPVGLWTACELKRAGLTVAVLERRTQRADQSRALTIHGRTIELFAMRGIAERFIAEGKPIPTGHYAALETRLDFSGFDTRFPFTLFLPQSRTEAIIEDHARELGVEILRGHTVEAITGDTAEGYRLSARMGEGVADFHARAVVGADARRSIVRQTAGIGYEGNDPSLSIMMGDVRLGEWNGPPVLMITNARGGVTIAPVSGNVMRVIVVDPERTHLPLDEPLSLEELQASVRRVLGEDLALGEPSWLSRFGDETRLATRYRHGNLFLAGDAAHLHLPAGGQGMNVGLQDAMNLGWKLAAVLNGKAPDALLGSYEAERRPVGAQLARNTQAQGALMTRFDTGNLALRAEMADLLTVREANRHMAGVISGFDLRYPAGGLFADGPGVGERVADRALTLADGASGSIHGLLAQGQWLHLSCEAGARVALPDWLDADSVSFVDARAAEHPASGHDAAAMLIRPDGYLAAQSLSTAE